MEIIRLVVVVACCCFCGVTSTPSDDVMLYFRYSIPHQSVYRLRDFVSIANNTHFNRSLPLMIYSHGWQENINSESVKTIGDSYLSKGGWNVLIIDWSSESSMNYAKSVSSLKNVGLAVGGYLLRFVLESGYPYKNIHLVGHSLGGQLVGLVARRFRLMSRNKFQIQRVTGLDPAGPGFEPQLPGSFPPLSDQDATFVDIIHTDAGFYGYKRPVANVNFYPNGGSRYQPDCNRKPILPDETQSGPLGFCSHWRSWQYYSDTVLNETMYPAIKCDSYGSFLNHSCDGNERAFMGYGVSLKATGSFFLSTDESDRE